MSGAELPGPSGIKPKRALKRKLGEKELEELLLKSDDEFSDVSDDLADYGWRDSDSTSDSDADNEELNTERNEEQNDENYNIFNVKKNKNEKENVSWEKNPQKLKKFVFQVTPGFKQPLPDGKRPIDFFYLLADDNLFNMICTETNAYAEEVFLEKGEGRIADWKPLMKDELRTFLGLLFHMGTIQCPRVQDYWKTHRLFNLPCFRKYMSRNRFLLIMRCLHFSRNPQENEQIPNDRLYKIRPIVEYFNDKMESIYIPERQLSLDESMMLYRGRLQFRQYIKNKRHRYGIKLYMLTEFHGLILNFVVYTGVTDDLGGTGHAANVVLYLLKNKLNLGYSVYMDNFYNSYSLAKQLLSFQTHCTGTLRHKRKHNSQDVEKAKLHPGETVARYSDGVVIGKWRDKRDVLYISTEHENELVETRNKRGQVKQKPKPIAEYNKYMSGVDLQDQIMSYYPFTRKTIRWYKKLGLHIICMMLHNAHVLYNKFSENKINFYDFRMSIIEEMLPDTDKEKSKKKKLIQNIFQESVRKEKEEHLGEGVRNVGLPRR